jgi:Flp pilus assembly protein TadG
MARQRYASALRKPISAIRNGLSVWNWLAAAHREDTRGQAIVLIALMLIGLIAIAALVFDGGTAYAQRRLMQNAADAGAIAGARQVALGANDGVINSAIQEYAVTRNKASTFTATYLPGGQAVGGGSVPSGTTGVQVIVTTTFNTYFANLIGNPTGAVGAMAKASFGPIQSSNNLQPLARKCTGTPGPAEMCGFVYGQPYDIWQGEGSGNFGWLGWDGCTNATCIAEELDPAYTITDYDDPVTHCTQIAVECWVQGKPGVSNSANVRAELNEWITLGQSGTPMTVVVYDTSSGGGANTNYHIVGFASFILQNYNLPGGGTAPPCSGTGQIVCGTFVEWVTGAPVCSGCIDTGTRSIHLTP